MNACRYRLILSVVFALIIVLPFVQKATKVFPSASLHGREKTVKKADWSLSSMWSGQAARQFEAYFARKVGFRSAVVRTVNQVNFSLFGEMTGNRGTAIDLGKDHWLYEHEYVRHYVQERGMDAEDRAHFIDGLMRFQKALKARGIAFVLVISPSKAETYPEYLPEAFRDRVVRDVPTRAYGMIRPELAAAGVNVHDVHQLFKRIKPTSKPLFAKGGTHWNFYGSFLSCQEMLRGLREKQGLDVVVPSLDSVVMEPAIGSDSDLLQLLNLLWFEVGKDSLVPYPIVSSEAQDMASRPNVLIVGDSFSFTLIDSLNLSKAVGDIDLLYYFRRHYRYPAEDVSGYIQEHCEADVGPIDYENVDWQQLLLDKDLVILETNQIMLMSQIWGFLDRAIKVVE